MKVRCNMCMNVFDEEDIITDLDTDKEQCPSCGKKGYLMDLENEQQDYTKALAQSLVDNRDITELQKIIIERDMYKLVVQKTDEVLKKFFKK